MKVLHVAETAKGGVGTYLDELIPLQRKSLGNASVRAIVPAQHRCQISTENEEGLLLFDRPERSAASLRRLRTLLAAELDSFRPEIVHLHSTFAGLVGRTMRAMMERSLVVFQPHGWAFEMWPGGAKRHIAAAVERALQLRCDGIIAVSQAELQQAIEAGLNADRIAVVMNGIAEKAPFAPPAPWPDARLKVLFIGRLDRQKGADILIRIAARQRDAISLRIAGEPIAGAPDLPELPDNAELLGWLDRRELTAQLAACDVLAMPSRWEAFGLTAIEAMRAARPVVAFAAGGLRDVVTHEATGLLVNPGDEEAFERALLQTRNCDLEAMGSAAYERFRSRFVSDRVNRDILALYRQFAGER